MAYVMWLGATTYGLGVRITANTAYAITADAAGSRRRYIRFQPAGVESVVPLPAQRADGNRFGPVGTLDFSPEFS